MNAPELVEVYTASGTHEAHLLKLLLSDAGIEARVVGDGLHNAVGELPASAILPRLWVRAADLDAARAVIHDYEQRRTEPRQEVELWECELCGEWNEPSFDFCWQCHRDRPN